MNTPNKLTVLRILLVPFFVAFLLIKQIPYNYLWATLIFAIASITDTIETIVCRTYPSLQAYTTLTTLNPHSFSR